MLPSWCASHDSLIGCVFALPSPGAFDVLVPGRAGIGPFRSRQARLTLFHNSRVVVGVSVRQGQTVQRYQVCSAEPEGCSIRSSTEAFLRPFRVPFAFERSSRFLYVARVRAIRVLGFESRRESFSQWQAKKKNARVITAGARGCLTCVLLLSFRNDDCSIDQLNTVDWTANRAKSDDNNREGEQSGRAHHREKESERAKQKKNY